MLYSKVDPKEHNCSVSSSLLSFTLSTVPNFSASFTQLWANHCHLQQLCLCIIHIERRKADSEEFFKFALPIPSCFLWDPILSHTVCSANVNWSMSQPHLNNISIHTRCTVLFPAVCFQAKHQSKDTRDPDHRSPLGSSLPPRKKEKIKKGIREVFRMDFSSPVRRRKSATGLAKWRENLVLHV